MTNFPATVVGDAWGAQLIAAITERLTTFSGCRAVNDGSAGTSMPNNSESVIALPTEDWDTDGYHSTVTNTSRLTIPAGKAGYYEIKAIVSYLYNATGSRSAAIYLNGSKIMEGGTPVTAGQAPQCSTVKYLAVGDYVELASYQDSGSPRSLQTAQPSTALTITLLSGAAPISTGRSRLDVAAPDDDFTATSLPAGWALQGYVSGDLTYDDGCMLVNAIRVPGNYIYRACPAGDWVATMKGTLHGPSGCMFGILCMDSSGNGLGQGTYTAPDAPIIGTVSAGSYNSSVFQSSSGPKGSVVTSGIPAWYRLRRVGNNYYGSMSLDGRFWSPETPAINLSTTMTRIGFGSFYSQPSAFIVDWFDVT